MSKLITPSLFGSIGWYNKAPESWKEKAYRDLYNTLARKYKPPVGAAKRGMDFEDHLYRILKKKKDIDKVKCSDRFKEILNHCKGGQFQVKSKSFIDIDDVEYCLYGKIDVLFPTKIIDIKTTGKWDQHSEEKYLGSMQHIMYLYNENMEIFQYIIAVFNGNVSTEIKEVKILNYAEKFREKLKNRIVVEIRKQNRFFKEHPALLDLYNNKYSLY